MTSPMPLTQQLDEMERLEGALRGVSHLIDDKELSRQDTQDISLLLGLLNQWQEANISRLRETLVQSCPR